jgi:tetratricopeptide (TPR) repeat protein
MRPHIQVKRSDPVPHPTSKNRLINALLTYLPGAWIDPRHAELTSLYRLRYKMAMEEAKYDTALIFLNKIIELDPQNVEAKLCKGELYYRCLKDYTLAIEQYNKVIRLTVKREEEPIRDRAREAMSEIMEMLS